ncbi:isochorismate lyase [Atopomonas sediminilitoris]|uniref:isochorismate lyase n=1 Tax=Atopomonas sediminilitoris TaxID=2919919 RepID=UPI001F4E87F9|nr:isochorismate lyase [Atopomonas sediminilitoris]MCJ8168303.1 isochorismate lyase [Atopomonas sediminilitoris]
MPNTLTPAQQCHDMAAIRAAIDHIDRQVIALLGQRYQYVLAAAPFKQSAQAVRAEERLRAMLKQRRAWAEEERLSPDAIEQMYRQLVEHFIAEELKHWQAQATLADHSSSH